MDDYKRLLFKTTPPEVKASIELERASMYAHFHLPRPEEEELQAVLFRIEVLGAKCRSLAEFNDQFRSEGFYYDLNQLAAKFVRLGYLHPSPLPLPTFTGDTGEQTVAERIAQSPYTEQYESTKPEVIAEITNEIKTIKK